MYNVAQNPDLCFRSSDRKISSLDGEHLKFDEFTTYEPICARSNLRDVMRTFFRCQSYYNKYEISGSIKAGNFAYTSVESPICKGVFRHIGFTKKSLLDRIGLASLAIKPFVFKINDFSKEI